MVLEQAPNPLATWCIDYRQQAAVLLPDPLQLNIALLHNTHPQPVGQPSRSGSPSHFINSTCGKRRSTWS